MRMLVAVDAHTGLMAWMLQGYAKPSTMLLLLLSE